jgi:hypothetical protein
MREFSRGDHRPRWARAEQTRVAATLLIEASLTLPHAVLREVADAYNAPLLIPHSVNPADYRDRLRPGKSVGDEADDWLWGLDRP